LKGKSVNLLKQLSLIVILTGAVNLSAKNVEYVEDAYAIQAAPELVQQVDRVAEKVGFADHYEVVVPKLAGLQINPWNRFIASGVNPGTKNLFILVNSDWFKGLPVAEQDFLIARCFVIQQMGGVLPKSVAVLPWIFMVLTLALWMGVFFAVRNFKFLTITGLIKLPNWARIAVLVAMVVSIRLLIFDRVQTNLTKVFAARHNVKVVALTVAKTGDKPAAALALMRLDAGVKAEIANGEVTLKPFENTFSDMVKDLERPVCHHGHGCKH
jgi:hypothetical protein